MQKGDRGERKSRLNTKTFAIKDGKGNIYVTVPVLIYKPRDPGYGEIASYFNEMTTESAVLLSTDWCLLDPLNSSTNIGGDGDDDDDK